MLNSQQNNEVLTAVAIICLNYYDQIEKKTEYILADNKWMEKSIGTKLDGFNLFKLANAKGISPGMLLSKQSNEFIPDLLEFGQNKVEEKRKLANQIKIEKTKSILENDIKPSKFESFKAIENKFKKITLFWKNNGKGTKIQCAAYCELLWDKEYFMQKKDRIKTCAAFALNHFGIDIKNQLSKTKEPLRNTHKELLEKYFK